MEMLLFVFVGLGFFFLLLDSISSLGVANTYKTLSKVTSAPIYKFTEHNPAYVTDISA